MTKARAIIRLYSRLLARLLHYANANPPIVAQKEFYALKTRLCKAFAEFQGYDIQEIKKACWGDYWIGCGPKCRRCGGTGIFDQFWVVLERWQWGRYVFHNPFSRTRVKPNQTITIQGRIEHPEYGKASREALLWLYLLTGEWRLLWRSMKGYCTCGWNLWPLVNLQKIVFRGSIYFAWRKCRCGRWFPTWGKGMFVCRKCWDSADRKYLSTHEIPF